MSVSNRPKPTPKHKSALGAIVAWLDDRTNFKAPVKSFLNYPVPGYVHKNLLYSLGGLVLISFLLQILTGLLLSFYYDPSPDGAYNSVDYVTFQAPLGWLMRGLHFYNASAIVILAVLHLLRTFAFGAYKKPREITWISGVLLLLVALGFAFTGYLLPWDQRGYWATKVGTEIAGTLPLIGEWQLRLIRGGPDLGQATLTRFYITHILLLPGALILLIGLHIYQLRFHGMAPPITKRGQALAHKSVPFFPNWVVTDATLGLGLLTLLIYLSWRYTAPLEFPADPSSTDFLPRPEWYFLFLFQLLKYFPGPLEPVAAFLIPLLVVGSMLLLPFLDRGEERQPWRKPITSSVAVVYLVMIVALTLLAVREDNEAEAVAAALPPVPAAQAKSDGESEAEATPIATTITAESGSPENIEPENTVAANEADPEVEPPENEIEPEIEVESEAENETVILDATVTLIELLPILENSPASLAPLNDKPGTLSAIEVGEATLDGYAEYWAEAPRLEVSTLGAKAALSGSDQNTGPVVTLQAVYDANNIIVRAEWPDESENLLKNGWIWDGSRFIKRGNEDGLALLWPIGNNAEFASKGCAIACHQADNDEDWWMGSESDNVRYDAWQWQAARTNPVGQAEDEWWGTLLDLNDTSSSRHGDAMESGGYQENVANDNRGPAFMGAGDKTSPFIPLDQRAPVDTALLNPNDVVPGYLLAPFVGSRGDVSARGGWGRGAWVVVMQRALNTGYDDDTNFIPGKRIPFGLAVFNDKSGINHNVASKVLILEWE
jgi:ubiquinol-cytochrome c reductase cytochrome b subunit